MNNGCADNPSVGKAFNLAGKICEFSPNLLELIQRGFESISGDREYAARVLASVLPRCYYSDLRGPIIRGIAALGPGADPVIDQLLLVSATRGDGILAASLRRDSRYRDTLLKALRSRRPDCQVYAAFGLGELGDTSAIPALQKTRKKVKGNFWLISKCIDAALAKLQSGRRRLPVLS